MSGLIEIKVPDIGDFKDVPVIEMLVKPGDKVKAEDPLVSLESDKATMDVPAPRGGVVKSMVVKVGDKVSEGTRDHAVRRAPAPAAAAPTRARPSRQRAAVAGQRTGRHRRGARARHRRLQGRAGHRDLRQGRRHGEGRGPLVTLESDKATMDVPAPLSGVVQEIKVKVGDKVSEGSVILSLATGGGDLRRPPSAAAACSRAAPAPAHRRWHGGAPAARVDEAAFALAYAGPACASWRANSASTRQGQGQRRPGPHPAGRRRGLRQGRSGAAAQAASSRRAAAASAASTCCRGRRSTSRSSARSSARSCRASRRSRRANLHRNWVVIPHVTNHDEADITDLEPFRVQMNKEHEKSGVKVRMLPFMIKAAVATLKKFPEFNASLDGDTLVSRSTATSASPPTRRTAWWCR